MSFMRQKADQIIKESLEAVMPDHAVEKALQNFQSSGGRTILVAAGKAAWQMADRGKAVRSYIISHRTA